MNDKFNKTGKIALILLAAGLLLMILSFAADSKRAFFNYLLMFVYIISIGVGSLAIVAMDYMTDAIWSTPFRRIAEFFSASIVLLPLLAVPLIFGMNSLYEWMHEDAVLNDPVIAHKSAYLNSTFFIIRLFLYILIWMIFYFLITGNSQKQDKTKEFKYFKKNIKLSLAFGPVMFFTLTFAAIDLMMSLLPHWYSTIYGVYYFAGSAVGALALWSFTSALLTEKKLLHPDIKPNLFHSMGTLFFAMIVFWAYIAFSQYLLIWYGDIPEETIWIHVRMQNGWQYLSAASIFIQFLIPFLVLMPGASKSNLKVLKYTGIFMLAAHYLDLYWLVMPGLKRGFIFGWNETGFILFMVGFFMMVFKYKASKVSITPIEDPKLEHGLAVKLYPDISID